MHLVRTKLATTPEPAQATKAVVYLCFVPIILFTTSAMATPPGQSRLGLHGGEHVGVLTDEATPFVSVGGHAGYGMVESVGPIDGGHHGMYGTLAGSLYLNPRFSAALGFDGLIQFHPEDDISQLKNDRSLLGKPYAILRSGFPIGRQLLLGGELGLWLPGGDAPSIVWSATTVDISALATLNPTAHQVLSFKAGFRIDNSENAAPDLTHVSYGDRVSFPFSSYHAILAGFLWMYKLNSSAFWTEFSAQMLLGTETAAGTSPMRIGVGGRRVLRPNIELNAVATVSLGQRPGIEADDPLVPIEPRLLLFAGATFKFGLRDNPPPKSTSQDGSFKDDKLKGKGETAGANKKDKVSDIDETKAGGSLSSTIVDTDGLPIAGAEVTVTANDFEKTTATDRNGTFEISGIPVGRATVTVRMPFFDPLVQTVDIRPGEVWRPKLPSLKESEVGSQIRGLVRNLDGAPIGQATVTVTPGDAVIVTSEDGEFSLDVEPGDYVVRIAAKGYKTQRRNLTVGTNSVEILNAELRKK